ncbi:MAG: leucine-rich repeat domain-containing protein [Bacteroides sp.]|nr:leucine-rich repeat domain-containing protein [Bacteroides sp.]
MLTNLTRGVAATFLSLLTIAPMSAYDFEVDGIYYDVVSFTDLTCTVTNNNGYMSNCYSGDITIPDVVSYNSRELRVIGISQEAFRLCTSLGNVIIGNNVESIGSRAFQESSIKEVIFGEKVSSIGDRIFDNCKNLYLVKLSPAIKVIPELAFRNTSALTTISLHEGIIELRSASFRESGISSITLPSTVTILGENCFSQSKLTSVDFNGSNIEEIPYNCFSSTPLLTSITIPSSVVKIGGGAFDGSALLEVKGGENVAEIEYHAFRNTPLVSMDLGQALKVIHNTAFINSADIRTINCYAPIAPELVGNAGQPLFDGKVYINAELNVPIGAEAQYQTAEDWKNFWNIRPILNISPETFSFNVYGSTTGGNGSVLINGEDKNRIAVVGNSSVTFTFVPDFGCKLTAVTLNNEDVMDKVSNNTLTIEKVTEILSLRATYTPAVVNFTIASGDKGRVTTTAPYGSSISCRIEPQEGWLISAVTFNGENVTSQVGTDGFYTTPAITYDGILAVSYISDPSGINTVVTNPNVNVIPALGSLTVTGAEPNDIVNVYTIAGHTVKSTYDKEFTLAPGIYIVCVAGNTFKVSI